MHVHPSFVDAITSSMVPARETSRASPLSRRYLRCRSRGRICCWASFFPFASHPLASRLVSVSSLTPSSIQHDRHGR